MSEYDAGVCNIGRREQRKRYFLGASGFTAAGILVVLSYFNYMQLSADFLLPVLVFVGFIGFIQGHLNFCAGYGLMGRENSSDEEPKEVPEKTRARDFLEALKIQLYSIFGTIVVMAVLEFLVL